MNMNWLNTNYILRARVLSVLLLLPEQNQFLTLRQHELGTCFFFVHGFEQVGINSVRNIGDAFPFKQCAGLCLFLQPVTARDEMNGSVAV